MEFRDVGSTTMRLLLLGTIFISSSRESLRKPSGGIVLYGPDEKIGRFPSEGETTNP